MAALINVLTVLQFAYDRVFNTYEHLYSTVAFRAFPWQQHRSNTARIRNNRQRGEPKTAWGKSRALIYGM